MNEKKNNMVLFIGLDCHVGKLNYPANNQVALQLTVADTLNNQKRGYHPGEPVAMATSCLATVSFEDNETAIKDYSENEGILEALVSAEIVKETGRSMVSGYADLALVKVLI